MADPVFSAQPLGGPFPGLRAFEAEEAMLFYGREVHVAELLDRLSENHFVAVTGTSGSGKSSLVRAGLRPALQRGYLIDSTSRWRFATMRPGNAPISALAAALSDTHPEFSTQRMIDALSTTSAGLSEAVSSTELASGESLLVIADQFEELFRFDATPAQQEEAALFVSQLLEATERRNSSIYVVVTMRSEFLGRCSEFPGLADAFNRSQYLVPRLTRDERRQAIERPLRLYGTEPEPALVQQVLNDVGEDPDQLPVMQHALLRSYDQWSRNGASGRLERKHYEAVGRIEGAIDSHGEEVFNSVNGAADTIVDQVFRSLTVMQGRVALRRPRSLGALYAICGATTPEQRQRIDTVVSAFADRQHAFLMLSRPALVPETIVDITHESVIRKWKRLSRLVSDESRSSEWYSDLARDVVRHQGGTASLWQDPELSGILQRARDERWNEAWAHQYRRQGDPSFAEVQSFLDKSVAEQTRIRQEADEQRNRELKQAQALARSNRRQTIALALMVVLLGVAAFLQYRVVQRDRQIALASAERESLSVQLASEQKALQSLQDERTTLLQRAAEAGTASPADVARLQQLTNQIDSAKAQAQDRENELNRLRADQSLNASDRGKLVAQVATLQQQLTATQNDRDRLQKQLSAPPNDPGAAERAALQRQLSEEQTRANNATTEAASLRAEIAALRGAPTQASPSTPALAVSIPGSSQDLARVFADGVGAYELKQWEKSAVLMWTAIAMRPNVRQPPKEVRMAGTRFIGFAPYSYLSASLFSMGADCASVAAALRSAQSETAPSEIRGALQSAAAKCPRG